MSLRLNWALQDSTVHLKLPFREEPLAQLTDATGDTPGETFSVLPGVRMWDACGRVAEGVYFAGTRLDLFDLRGVRIVTRRLNSYEDSR